MIGGSRLHLVSGAEPALLDLLAALDRGGYDFVAPTPATHAIVG